MTNKATWARTEAGAWAVQCVGFTPEAGEIVVVASRTGRARRIIGVAAPLEKRMTFDGNHEATLWEPVGKPAPAADDPVTFARVADGRWGVRVPAAADRKPGETIKVTRYDGETRRFTLRERLDIDNGDGWQYWDGTKRRGTFGTLPS